MEITTNKSITNRIPLELIETTYVISTKVHYDSIRDDWVKRKLTYKDLYGKYGKYCDKSIQKKIKATIEKLDLYIKELEEMFTSKFQDDHKKIIKNIISLSKDNETIKKLTKQIKKYESYEIDLNSEISENQKKIKSYYDIYHRYSKLETYKDYYSLDVFPHNIGDQLEDDCKVKNLINELNSKIKCHFYYNKDYHHGTYYSTLSELSACAYFKNRKYIIKNATTREGGVDLKIIDSLLNNSFFVEVWCPAIYYDDTMVTVLNNSGASWIPHKEISNILRQKILPGGKKAKQILKFIASRKVEVPSSKVILWIDLSSWVRETKINISWLSPCVSDSLVRLLYDQELSFVFDATNFSSGKLQITRGDNPKVCEQITGIICYSDTDKKAKYIHNPKFEINNPCSDFPICDFYYFKIDDSFKCIGYEQLKREYL